jgi:hypothetical protein
MMQRDEHGTRTGDYFDGFVHDEARAPGFTLDELRAWPPPGRLEHSTT